MMVVTVGKKRPNVSTSSPHFYTPTPQDLMLHAQEVGRQINDAFVTIDSRGKYNLLVPEIEEATRKPIKPTFLSLLLGKKRRNSISKPEIETALLKTAEYESDNRK